MLTFSTLQIWYLSIVTPPCIALAVWGLHGHDKPNSNLYCPICGDIALRPGDDCGRDLCADQMLVK